MKYHQPYGISDPQAPYINGDPSIGRLGSIIPAEAVEYPQREFTNFFNISNILPADSDLYQLARSVQVGLVNFSTDIGAQNAMVCPLMPPIIGAEYPLGLMVRAKLKFTNLNDATHTTFTMDAGIGARSVVMPDGSQPADKTLKAGGVYLFIFDGTRWQVAGAPTGGGTGTGTTYMVNIPYVRDSGPSSNNIVAIYTPPVTAITEGLFIAVKLAYPLSTGVCNITVNTNPVKHIARPDGSSPVAGDAGANQILLLCFDGVNFQIVGVLGIPVSRAQLQAEVPYPYVQMIPPNVLTQVSGLNTIITNTLQTSTWDGTVLTIGNGEAGLWHIKTLATVGNGLQHGVYTGALRIRAGTPAMVCGHGYGPAPAFPSDCSAAGSDVIELQVGDIIQVYTAHYTNPASVALPYRQAGNWSNGVPVPNIEATFINRP